LLKKDKALLYETLLKFK
jgi:hypothetical protein